MSKSNYTSFLKPLVAPYFLLSLWPNKPHDWAQGEGEATPRPHRKAWVQGGVNNGAVMNPWNFYTGKGAG